MAWFIHTTEQRPHLSPTVTGREQKGSRYFTERAIIYIEIYKTVILLVVLCGCETCSLTLREEHRLGFFLEQSVEEDIWTEKRGRRIVEKIA